MARILPYANQCWFRNITAFRKLYDILKDGEFVLSEISRSEIVHCNKEARFFNLIGRLGLIIARFEETVSNLVFVISYRTRGEKKSFETFMGILCEFYNLLLDGGNLAYAKAGIIQHYASPNQYF